MLPQWPEHARQANDLIVRNQVAALFRGWTSASRKAMLPVVEALTISYFIQSIMKDKNICAIFFIQVLHQINNQNQQSYSCTNNPRQLENLFSRRF